MHVQAVGPSLGRLQARIVDAVEEVLERTGHVADVGRRAEQVPGRAEHVHGPGGQRGNRHHLDAIDLVGARSAQHGFEHGLHGRRRGVVHDKQPAHVPGA